MKIVAKALKGQEFFYRASTAHKVSERSANVIAKALNESGYELKDNEVWHVFDIDEYDSAYGVVMFQSFERRNHKLVRLAY